MSHKIKIIANGKSHDSLADILPGEGKLEILFIAKTPATVSVNAGHYFQGKQGRMLWNKLAYYNILKVPSGHFEDDYLLSNNYGLTDIVKVPRDYGSEPSDEEYRNGLSRILDLIKKHKPKVVVFVYKKVLDNILRLNFGQQSKSKYGFNTQLEIMFGSKIFVFPMPGTPCTKAEIDSSMTELEKLITKNKKIDKRVTT